MLTGQIALITGASRGIGAAIAQALGEQGAIVVGTATSEAGAQAISQAFSNAKIKGEGMALNVNDAAQVEVTLKTIAEKYGDVSILVNNAGITRDTLLMRMKDEVQKAALSLSSAGTRIFTGYIEQLPLNRIPLYLACCSAEKGMSPHFLFLSNR